VPVLTLRDRLDALQHRLQSRQHGRQPSQDMTRGWVCNQTLCRIRRAMFFPCPTWGAGQTPAQSTG
jgi:hypothetical protein